jgi:hypothetical protein
MSPRKDHTTPRLAKRRATVRLVGLACQSVQRRDCDGRVVVFVVPSRYTPKLAFFSGDRGDSYSSFPKEVSPASCV